VRQARSLTDRAIDESGRSPHPLRPFSWTRRFRSRTGSNVWSAGIWY